ncbi:hypothetical protein F4560_001059 [Saccharothrix ecbatanensis]|uniref:SAF domain-containing protein n=1 Tax=Saccharothrix ecbatanensis TaxID=1105145 RepID=A0A7W9HG19_9PSEU|nr:SAF domain-containing protein [Saccharothrix ecbatanensis]MBB5801291.1 hypothetical protein [Saccharothrix ecbatanensis]
MTASVLHTKETAGASASAWAGRDRGKALSRFGGGRRRRLPHLLVGVLLVLGCAAGGVVAVTEWAGRESVLVLARSVVVGQVLTARDLEEVSMTTDSGVDLVHAAAVSTVVGRPVAYNLPEGSLVTRSLLGTPQVPSRGDAIAALGLKPGQFPPDIAPGATVIVLATATQGAGSADVRTSSWTAVVTGLAASETDQITVISLQLPEGDAKALASAPAGQLSLVMIAGGGR